MTNQSSKSVPPQLAVTPSFLSPTRRLFLYNGAACIPPPQPCLSITRQAQGPYTYKTRRAPRARASPLVLLLLLVVSLL